MIKLNKDCLFMIFNELANDKSALYSCLLVNREWCEDTVPVLWKHPWKLIIPKDHLYHITIRERLLLNTILLHLWDKSQNILKEQRIKLFTTPIKKPLFPYISYCKYFDFSNLTGLIADKFQNYDESRRSILKSEMLKMFIKNTRPIALAIPQLGNCQLHFFPGIKRWLSNVEHFTCDDNISQEIFDGLVNIYTSIKSLNIIIGFYNNPGLFRFIEAQRQLKKVCFSLGSKDSDIDFSLCKQKFGNALTANANTIQHIRLTHASLIPFSVFSSLINLKSLCIGNQATYEFWSELEEISSFPNLYKLVTYKIPLERTAKIIENSTSKLTEIIIEYTIYHQENYNRCIQAICKTCPNLKYLKIIVKITDDFYKLTNLLRSCQHLEGLVIEFPYSIKGWNYNTIRVDEVDNTYSDIDDDNECSLVEDEDDSKILCEILAKYSPMSLYKFKLQNMKTLTSDTLRIFFDNWKDRPSMLLQTMPGCKLFDKHFNIIREYMEKGIIKKYNNILCIGDDYDYFEWM